MATAAYRDWVRKGRPWENSLPVRDFVASLATAGWAGGALGTIGDEAHLQAEHPQDHTPFSQSGWPGSHPYPLILALDVMHNPASGRDVAPLVDYWLSEAIKGRQPWLKYIVWRAQRFDVRNNWTPVAASGHLDHAHLSFRTDHARTGLGGWSVIPNGGNAMDVNEANMHKADTHRALATLQAIDAVYQLEGEPEQRHEVNELARLVREIKAGVLTLANAHPLNMDPEAIAQALAADDEFVGKLGRAIAESLGEIPSARDTVEALANALLKGIEL